MFLFPFLYIGIIQDILHCLGMKDIAKEQLKINETGKMREQIVRFKKYEGIFSAVLNILSIKLF